MNVEETSVEASASSLEGPRYNRRNESLFFLNTAASSAFFTVTGVACTVGVYFTCLVRELGGSERAVSFIPVAWCVAGLPSALLSRLSDRVNRNRTLAVVSILFASGVMALTGAALLLFGSPSRGLLVWSLGGLLLAHLASNLYLICYLSWMPDVVSDGRVGRVMAGRLLIWSLVQCTSLPVCGWILQHAPGIRTFGAVFIGASILGMLSAAPLLRLPAEERSTDRGQRGSGGAFALLDDPNLRRMMGTVFLVNLSSFFVGAYGVVFVKEFLQFPYRMLGIAFGLPSAMMAATIMGWGRLVDAMGSKSSCLVGVFGMTLGPLLLFLNAPGHTEMVWVAMAWSGAISSAYSASWLSLLCDLAPRERRSSALALVWFTCSLSGLFTPYLGGWIVAAIGARTWALGTWRFCGIHLLFLGQSLIAGLGLPLCRSIEVKRAVPTRHLAGMFLRNPWNTLWAAVYGDVLLTALRGQKHKDGAPVDH